MLGEGYISKQFYTYQDLSSLKEILKITNTTNFEIHKEENVIEYTIDRRVWTRLKDLIYQIQEGLIKFHIGQLLDLYEKILIQVQFLESQNIDHEYLDSNRIWLVLQNGSDFLSIVDRIYKYEIAFTGYQCQLYENNECQTKASEKIFSLFYQIQMNFINNKVWLIRDQKGNDQTMKIYQSLINSFSQRSIAKSLQEIQEIKINTKYQQESQMVYIDEKTSDYSLSLYRQHDLKVELRNLFNSFHGQSQLLLEYTLKSLIPLYSKSVDSFRDILVDTFPKINPKNQERFQKEMQTQIKELDKQTQTSISAGIQQLIKQSETNFKFSFNKDEIQEMENDIYVEFKNRKIFKYFENSIWYQNEDTLSSKICLSMKFIQDLIEERFNLKLQMMILYLINSLI